MGQPSFPVFNRVGHSQLWLFSQVKSYKKNYFSSSFQKNIFFWKFLPLFFNYGMFIHKINIFKSSYFFFNKRFMWSKSKKNFKYIFKRIFSKFMYRRSHKIHYGRFEIFDGERTYRYAPLYYRKPFFRSLYFSKLWIFKQSNLVFLKMYILISDIITYDSKKWIRKKRNFFKKKSTILKKRRRNKVLKKKKIKKFAFMYRLSLVRLKYIFKLINVKNSSANYFWF